MININILLTGGAGYIGSCLIPELLKKHKVIVFDNLMYGYNGLIPHINNPDFKFIKGDIQNKEEIKNALIDVDIVIHLAALVGYPICKAQPELAKKINYYATKKLVECCKVPIIFTSTGGCYGSFSGICDEETPLKPKTEYAITKVQAEREIQKNPDFLIYRLSTGFGMSLRPRLDLLVNDFVIKAIKNKELIVYEKNYLRSFIHVKDIAGSIIFAINHFDEMNHEIYNIGHESLCLTKEEIAFKIKDLIDYHLKFAEFGKDLDKRNYMVSFKKINSLGFKTKYTIEDGIKEMLNASSYLDQRECYYNYMVLK